MVSGLPLHNTYKQMVRESNPFNRIHRLIDTFEEFSKFLTIISIRDYIEFRDPQNGESQNISYFLINRLYAPTLGTWHEFLYRTSKYLAGKDYRFSTFSKDIHTFLGYMQSSDNHMEFSCCYKGKEYQIKNVQEGFNLLTEVRNDYAHGATPADEICEEDYNTFLPLLDLLLKKASFLNNCGLEKSEIEGHIQPVLKGLNQEELNLYPFMVFNDGEWYYLCDSKLKYKEKLTFLSYYTAQKIVDSKSYQYLKKFFPQFELGEDKVNFKRQYLLDTVIGRYEDAKNIEKAVLKSAQSRVFYIFGDPGIGKSAVAAFLDENFFKGFVKALHLFIHNDTYSLQPETVLRSISKPLAAAGLIGTPEIITTNSAEIKKNIDIILHKASETARKKNTKIIIIIDGLDEAHTISEHLYNILPFHPPPLVYIIYFSRRKDDIYSKVHQRTATWSSAIELKPLKKTAIRAILWQAISKYTADRILVDRVVEASQGNPLYLKFLVNAILEKRMDLSSMTLLPRDIIEYYDSLILQSVQQNQDLPVIETALAFSVCCEPLEPEQIKKILNQESLEKILLSIKALSEIIRPVITKAGQKKIQLFHKSIADFLQKQYAETAKKIEIAALFCVVPEKGENLQKWFFNFLEGKSLLKLRDEKNITMLIEHSRTWSFVHQLLIKSIINHDRVREIIFQCYDLVCTRRNMHIFSLVNDCFLKLAELSPDKYIYLITRLNKQYPEDENLKRHLIDALVLLRFSQNHYHKIIDLVIGYLLDYALVKGKYKRSGYMQIINAVSSYACSPETFNHLKYICEVILNIHRSESIPLDMYLKIEKMLRRETQFFLHPRFNRLVKKIRVMDNSHFVTRGNENYHHLFYKMGLILLKMPGQWFNFCYLLFYRGALVIRNGIKIQSALMKRLGIFAQIMQRSFPLIFTSGVSPVDNPMGLSMISQIEEVIHTRLQSIDLGEINLYELIKQENSKKNSQLLENLAYILAVIAMPLLKLLWNYSQVGLEAIPEYPPKERGKIGKSFHLLRSDLSIDLKEENMLVDFLSIDDAWKNYFAKAALIIHGNTEFSKGRRILKRMLEENSLQPHQIDENTIKERLRIFRQYFAVHTYLIRRAKNLTLIAEMSESLEYCLDKLMKELETEPEIIRYFIKSTLFDQGDPFNPLLPVGIYQGRTNEIYPGIDKLDSCLNKFLNAGVCLSGEWKLKLLEKLLTELLSLSLFYPGLAIKTALRYYSKFKDKDENAAKIVLEKLYLLDLLRPGNLQPIVIETGLNWEEIKKGLLGCTENLILSSGKVEAVAHEIRIFSWHECITALMVTYPRIRDMLINEAEQAFTQRVSMPLLVQRIVLKFLSVYFSEELGEAVKNIFKSY